MRQWAWYKGPSGPGRADPTAFEKPGEGLPKDTIEWNHEREEGFTAGQGGPRFPTVCMAKPSSLLQHEVF